MLTEVFVPDTKPATEWILGRPVRKVSPRRRHALLQLELGAYLRLWARGRGEVGTEWKFRLTPPGEYTRPLVPDVAYISYESLDAAGQRGAEEPLVAPDVAFEIHSPGDKQLRIAHKTAVYLQSGSRAVVHVDPQSGTIRCFTPGDGPPVVYGEGSTFAHPALPGFTFALDALFDILDPKGAGSRI